MTGDEFVAIVNKYGEENILSISYDNSAGHTFPFEGMFTLANNYIADIECLKFIEYDTRMNPYHTLKRIESIQSIVVKDDNVSREKYNYEDLRG